MKIPALLLVMVMVVAPAMAESVGSGDELATGFTILVGFPSTEAAAGGGVVLIPGTVIPLVDDAPVGQPQDVVERGLSFTKAVAKLWSTFRLDPLRRPQLGKVVMTPRESVVELPTPEGSGVTIEATLRSSDDETVTYRIVFRQKDETIADTTVAVPRGGRSVVGGMDGEAAPYLFVFIQPDPPHGSTTRWHEGIGVSQPVAIEKTSPVYPVEALKAGASGVVVLEAIIGTDGRVLDVRILESPHPSLGQAAATAVGKWSFEPARDADGAHLKVSLVLTLTFHLK